MSVEAKEIMERASSSTLEFPGTELPTSMGTSYGKVVPDTMGSDYKKDLTVLGDPVNRVSKLSKLAGPWETLLDPEVNMKDLSLPASPILVKDDLFRRSYILE